MGLTLDFQWWQLWTCHVAHWDARHLLLNVFAALPPLLLLPRQTVVRLMAWCFAAAPLLSLTLIATGVLRGEYRGASGLVVALWSFAAIALLRNGEIAAGQLLVAAVFMKLLAELAGWWPAQSDAFVSLAAAHVAGALIGILAHVFVEPRTVIVSAAWMLIADGRSSCFSPAPRRSRRGPPRSSPIPHHPTPRSGLINHATRSAMAFMGRRS